MKIVLTDETVVRMAEAIAAEKQMLESVRPCGPKEPVFMWNTCDQSRTFSSLQAARFQAMADPINEQYRAESLAASEKAYHALVKGLREIADGKEQAE